MKSVRRLAWVSVGLVLGAGGCGEDQENGPTSAADAAVDAAAEARAPDAGSDSAMEGATDGPSEAAEDAPSETAADAPTEAAATDAQAEGAATPAYGLFVATDYSSQSRLAVLDLDTRMPVGATLDVASGDVIPYASGKRGFLLDRAKSAVLVLDRTLPWTVKHTIDVKKSDGASANPYAAIISTGAKTYVLRYETNTIVVADANTGALTGTIDLSAFVGSGDPDGFVDASDGVYDPTTGRVYVLLQRIDHTIWSTQPDGLLPCLPLPPLVIAIDTATDQIADLGGGDAGGKGIALLGRNPSVLVPDLAAGRLLFADRGCYDTVTGSDGGVTEPRSLRGIESLTLATGMQTWLYQYTQSSRLEGLVLANATHAFVDLEDSSYAHHWYAWNPTTASLGAAVASFPDYPVHHGGKVFGIAPTALSDGGKALSIVAYDVASGQTQTLVADAFNAPALGYPSGTAIIR